MKRSLSPALGYRYAAGDGSGVLADTQAADSASLGHMDGGAESYPAGEGYGSSFEDEPPLLQELGIDFRLIMDKVRESDCIYLKTFFFN